MAFTTDEMLYNFLYNEAAMRTITYSVFRNDLKNNIRRLRDDADTLMVTNRDEDDNIVVMNARDYESLMETVRIYSNPALHDKVLRGMQQTRDGRASEHDLIDA